MAAEKHLHLAGIGVGHSIAPSMHNCIAKSLDVPWTFYSTECATLESVISLARDERTVGLVVTMPYKTSILPHVDTIDEIGKTIGACNLVYRDPAKPQQLHASNTDWLGVKGISKGRASDVALHSHFLQTNQWCFHPCRLRSFASYRYNNM